MGENITKKYRPRKFSDILGQPGSVATLTEAINARTLPPAYLFFGPRGCGKTTASRLLALALNCTEEGRKLTEPCGKCASCLSILNDTSPYLMEFDGATNGKVDDVRQLMASVCYIVPDGNTKVITIDECHMLTKEAWNAALKTIEEPPKNVLFVFCTTEIQKVIPTIKSRCTPVQFPSVHPSVIVSMLQGILQKENVPYDEEAVQLIAKNAYGSLRDAQSIMEGFIRSKKVSTERVQSLYQNINPNTILTYFNSVLEGNIQQATAMTIEWIRLGCGPELIISSLLEHLRNMVMDFMVLDTGLKSILKAQRAKIGEYRLVNWIEFFYTQLRFIRDFPMEYTLVIDLITIKLVTTPKEQVVARARKSDKDEEKEAEKPKARTYAIINQEKLLQLQRVCEGTIEKVTQPLYMATIKNKKGTCFDVVSDASFAESPYYIMGEELESVLKGYPQSMQTFAKANTK